jgi:glycosyltransferase involved in cell wall biosynthesis
MRIAWLAPFDLRLLRDRVGIGVPDGHPAPWITNGLRALAGAGEFELHLVTYTRGLARDCTIPWEGVTIHLLRPPLARLPRAPLLFRLDLPRFQATLRAIDPDVVHGHGTENLFALAAVLSPYPNVVSMQAVMGALVRTQRPFSRRALHYGTLAMLERRALRRAARVLVEAPFVTGIVQRINPSIRTTVVGNIVSPEFCGVRRVATGKERRVLFVGTLVEQKGVADAIAAFHLVAAAHPEVGFEIIGQGSEAYTRCLHQRAAAGPAAARIRFRGFLRSRELAAEYETATLLVAPTHYDTSPNVVSEALTAGVPVVAASTGGLPYMLDEGRGGRLVAPRDVRALAEAIDWVLGHEAEAASLAAHGQQRARERYSAPTFAAAVGSVYRELLAGAGR